MTNTKTKDTKKKTDSKEASTTAAKGKAKANSVHPIEKALGIKFKDRSLLEKAFTHRSFAKQHKNNQQADNERLEFFGDAILKFAVSKYLFTNYKDKNEGALTKLRSQIISDATLYNVALELNFNQYIHLSYSESKCQGELKPSILSDALEAFIGAYYLDSGIQKVSKFITDHIVEFKLSDLKENPITDYKSIVQEFLQKTVKALPKYSIVKETGPEHEKVFTVSIEFTLNGQKVTCMGTGTNKKKAEQSASKSAYVDYIQKALAE